MRKLIRVVIKEVAGVASIDGICGTYDLAWERTKELEGWKIPATFIEVEQNRLEMNINPAEIMRKYHVRKEALKHE